MRRIILTQNKYASVDDQDYDNIVCISWSLHKGYSTNYARAQISGKHYLMHRFILGVDSSVVVNHLNFNGLDNTRSNLEICTFRDNLLHRKRKGSSIYPGVSWYPTTCKWVSQICVNGHNHRLGYFNYEKNAALAYQIARRLLTAS
jgi:hypothetical protein